MKAGGTRALRCHNVHESMEDTPEKRYERLQNAIQDTILRNFPNPERKGCPGDAMVEEVAGRRELIEDDAWQHVTHCSPCYAAFLQYKNEFRLARRRKGLKLLIGAVTVAVLTASITVYEVRHRSESSGVSEGAEYEAAAIDLRNTSSKRGTKEQSSNSPALFLPRKRLALSIYLPFGSEPGDYEFRLLRGEQPVITAHANAKLEQGIVVLSARVDTSTLAPGEYAIGVRQGTWNWDDHPVTLR
jgi:hypothetical protein